MLRMLLFLRLLNYNDNSTSVELIDGNFKEFVVCATATLIVSRKGYWRICLEKIWSLVNLKGLRHFIACKFLSKD